MNDKETDKKISSFEEMKKKLENQKTDIPANPNIPGSTKNIQEMFSQLGIDVDEKVLSDLIKSANLDEISKYIDPSTLSAEDIYKGLENIRNYEKKLKQEKQMYRTFSQWMPFRRPYNLSSLFQIERIKAIAEENHIIIGAMDSKNEIIEKMKPSLKDYILGILKKLDNSMMEKLGMVIYADGCKVIDKPLDEQIEQHIDFFTSKALLMRVNDNGKHCIVIPSEMLDIIRTTNFNEVALYNSLNSIINQTAMAFANAYGAYPKSLLYEAVQKHAQKWIEQLHITSVEKYIDDLLKFTFSRTILSNSMYGSIVYSDDYINHGIIEVTKNLIDIQNGNIKEYKQLDFAEIQKRGKEFYYDDSLYLNEVVKLLLENNDLDKFEIEQLKNQIYLFSFLEFEPSLILQILEMRYTFPEGTEYAKLVDILRTYYKNSEKWILKGHTSFEINHNPNSTPDIQKIISFDYFKNN